MSCNHVTCLHATSLTTAFPSVSLLLFWQHSFFWKIFRKRLYAWTQNILCLQGQLKKAFPGNHTFCRNQRITICCWMTNGTHPLTILYEKTTHMIGTFYIWSFLARLSLKALHTHTVWFCSSCWPVRVRLRWELCWVTKIHELMGMLQV